MAPSARLLDLSRLASRAGRVLTGVDRVECAYLRAVAADPVPAFGIVRTAAGFILLDRAGMTALDRAISADAWRRPGPVDRLLRRGDPVRAGVEATLRALALARIPRGFLRRALRRRLPEGTAYINVGQTSLRPDLLAAMRGIPGAGVAVMVHDTIPLDHPQWQRPGSDSALMNRLKLAAGADLILTNSAAVAADVARHMAPMWRVPPILPVHLGVDLAPPDPAALPAGLPPARPYFVTVGTIEARKNHALLLDVWEMLGPDPPPLLICGGRGWRAEDVFARLDRHPPGVREVAGLPDGALAALVAGARAMLFPSRAEGFGLPVLEALGRGVPAVCGDLAIWREVAGEAPVYLGTDDRYLWQKTVVDLARDVSPPRLPPVAVPDWDAHFKVVLSAT